MKHFILCLLLLLSVNCYGQQLSKTELSTKIEKLLSDKFNIVRFPRNFDQCAYKIYRTYGDNEGFKIGHEVVIKCVAKYINQVHFSDGGKKIKTILLAEPTKKCIEESKKFDNKINPKNYCGCLANKMMDNQVNLKAIITGSFYQSASYHKMSKHCISQNLAKKEFDKRLLSLLSQKYNIKKVPAAFYACNYNLYKKNEYGDFFSKPDPPLPCLKKYYTQFEYSDHGDKMRNIALKFGLQSCKQQNKAYQNKIDLPGYCSCINRQYKEYDIKFELLIDKNFIKTKLYQKMALHCFILNEK